VHCFFEDGFKKDGVFLQMFTGTVEVMAEIETRTGAVVIRGVVGEGARTLLQRKRKVSLLDQKENVGTHLDEQPELSIILHLFL